MNAYLKSLPVSIRPDRRSDVHVVYLKYASAAELVQILSQLATSMQKQGDPKAQGKDISVQADDNVNALIIQSPDSEFQLMQAVIDQLDIERGDDGDVHVVYLKYAKAADMVDLY